MLQEEIQEVLAFAKSLTSTKKKKKPMKQDFTFSDRTTVL